MRCYRFMKPGYLKNKKEVLEMIVHKYGENYNKESLKKYSTLVEYLRKVVCEQKAKNLLDNFTTDLREGSLVKSIEAVIYSPEEYISDLQAAVYMGLLYQNPENVFLKYSKDELEGIKTENMPDDERYEIENFIKDYLKVKKEVHSAWQSESIKINKDNARENYPVPVYERDSIMHEFGNIRGGCYHFHKALISNEHIGLFDYQTVANDCAKYSYKKMHKICDRLANTPVENLLLMEYSLGIGYANYIYPYVRHIASMEEWECVAQLVDGMNIPAFFIQKKVNILIWEYIKERNYSRDAQEFVNKMIQIVEEIVMDTYESVLEFWWYVYCLYGQSQDRLRTLELNLWAEWKRYFSEEDAYQDEIKRCGIRDWRGIKKVEDCFFCIEENLDDCETEIRKQHIFIPISIIDSFGGKADIYIENVKDVQRYPIAHDIGREVLTKTISRMKLDRLSTNDAEVCLQYKKIRQEIFEELRTDELNKMEAKSLKRPAKNGKTKPEHIYALLQETIILSKLIQRGTFKENN